MARSKSHLLRFLVAVAVVAAAVLTTADAGEGLSWIPTGNPSSCKGSMAECMAGGEFEMESETNRRILATRSYVSYGSLQANNVPCSRRGASYYNCRSGGSVNPYMRSCTTATQCRS